MTTTSNSSGKRVRFLTTALLVAVASTLQAQQAPRDLPPGWIALPQTEARFKLGGYVKVDLIHDFKPIGSPDFFDVSKIPTNDSQGQSSHLNAKEARLFLDVRSPSKVGEIKTYVEGDFYGSGSAFRLRHAYLEINGTWLAGQTWSNFMDEDIIPATLDFEKPAAYAFIRHAQLRWKHASSTGTYFSLALEEPSASAQAPSQPGTLESPLPDLTARYRVTKAWGHVQVSGFAGVIRFRPATGENDNEPLFGANLSGQFKLLEKDRLTYQAIYGPGVARYRGGLSAAPDASGDRLDPLKGVAFTGSYLRSWSPAWSSNFVYNYGHEYNTDGQPDNAIYSAAYSAVNLLWHFVPNAFAGVEYLHGVRTDKNDANGSADRLQFSVKYAFN